MSWATSDEGTRYVVRFVYNDTEGEPGEALYGPFDTVDEADDFCQNWRADDTEVEDAWVESLNPALKEEDSE